MTIESNHLSQDKYGGYWNYEGSYINLYKIDTLEKHYGADWFKHAGDLFSTTDSQKRFEFYNRLRYVQSATSIWVPMVKAYNAEGIRLIELLRKEYHLENE